MKNNDFSDQITSRWEFFSEIDSTNLEAQRRLGHVTVPSGHVIYTDCQTKGMGQRGKLWYGEAEMNLAMSYVFSPKSMYVERAFAISQAVALSISDFLHRSDIAHVSIKWPNDIYVGMRKICGILIQNSLAGKKIEHSIIGIGINVNQVKFPTSLPNPCSLKQTTGQDWSIHDLVVRLTEYLDKRLAQIDLDEWAMLDENYAEMLFLKGKTHDFIVEGMCKQGTILGVEKSGKLRVKMADKVNTYQFGQIEYDTSGFIDDR